MEEKLPIKFFAKRKIDEMRVEPGGGNNLPAFVLTGEKLQERAKHLSSNLKTFEQEVLRKKQNKSSIPFVFKAKINKNALAKSHRQEISELLRNKNDNIIGISEGDELIVKIKDENEIKAIASKLQKYDENQHAISCVEDLKAYKPRIEVYDTKNPIDYKIKFLNFQDYEENKSIQSQFEQSVSECGLECKKTKYSDNLTIYNLKNATVDSIRKLSENNADLFDAIFSIVPMPNYYVTSDITEDSGSIEIIEPEEDKKYVTVGILDSGIKAIPQLSSWLETDKYSPFPEDYINKTHGTSVAGIALYGDKLENKNWTGASGFKIFNAIIMPDEEKDKVYEDDIINNIREAVEARSSDIHIWNLSVSIPIEIVDDTFSDFAVALDELQNKYNILICKSAGNCKNFRKNLPKGRIVHGADSIRSLVVGSVAHEKNVNDESEIDHPSPFTRRGPGPAYIIKPDVVHYGGNASKNSNTGTKTFDTNGNIIKMAGTSFATPRVTSLAAGIYQELDEEFDPLLLKALIIHSANYPSSLDMDTQDKIYQLGFGKPKTVSDIIFNTPNEATLILRDNLAKGEFINIMDFPMPDELINDGFYTGQITVTLVTDPLLDASQGSEYCQSEIDVKLGTYSNKVQRDTTKRHILNEIGREESQNILLGSLYSRRVIKSNNNDFANKERMLIQYRDKYHPTKKYAVDLSEMTEANKNRFLSANKQWFLNIEGMYRSFIEDKAKRESFDLNQEFCLIITIKDPNKQVNVYDKVTQKLNEFNFLHNNIKLATDIDISI